MSKKGEVKRANTILLLIISIALLVVGFRVLNSMEYTGKTVRATATQVVQMFSKSSTPYYRVVLQINNGELITKNMPLDTNIKVGQIVSLQKFKRKFTGSVSYR